MLFARLTGITDFLAKFTLNSGKEHVCCVAQKPILGYDQRGFPDRSFGELKL
ncbi:hypothetical protein AWB69_06722 [Caballeronia udeis]|uniref:Uncharacterized protein n=1 Tax=Caballeronia udeis TaxID=1232866 RepID=A0A158IX30_9BURK|nr:hypothetical protein AWB69_06722 [Caballeronia udeis]